MRKSNKDDMSSIHHLIEELEETEIDKKHFEKAYIQQINDKRWYCLVEEDGTNIIGLLNMRFEDQLHHSYKVCEILEFIVDEKYRCDGLGKKMFNQAKIIAKENGCGQIELCSSMRRLSAHAFYEHMGMAKDHFNFVMKI